MDHARYRAIFVEDAGEHLGEMERRLLDLEKDPSDGDALETCFRLAHSVKGMAAALGFAPIAAAAHALEDGFAAARAAACADPAALPGWIAAVDDLARFLACVRDTGECPPALPSRRATAPSDSVASTVPSRGGGAGKKASRPPEPTRSPAGSRLPRSGSGPRPSTGSSQASAR